MRIISTFHDYYDCGQSYGQDSSMIYQRHPKEVRVAAFPFKKGIWWRGTGDIDINYHVVGFCGKVYPILRVSKGLYTTLAERIEKICFSLKDFDNFIESNCKEIIIEEYRSQKYKYTRGFHWNLKRHKMNEFFEEFFSKQDKFGHLFENERSPIFSCEARRYIIEGKDVYKINYNCMLKAFEFFRLFDPYMAYQEISMFFGNMAEPRKKIPVISDEVMSEIKGFDKFSFRKPKREK